MTTRDSLPALPKAGRRLDAASYRAIAESVSDLCRDDANLLNERELAIAFDILRLVLGRVEAQVRRTVSQRVARRTDLPRDLALPLAHDEIYVAVPMLLHSPVMTEDDLIGIARHSTDLHRLAIAERRGLGVTVTRVLIDIGGPDVIRCLIDNSSAGFDRECFAILTDRARRNTALQEPLVERPDFPPDLAAAMLLWVGAGMKRIIARRFGAEIAATIRPDIDSTLQEVLALLPSATAAAGYGRFPRVFGATEQDLSVLTRLDPATVRNALNRGGPRAFALMCRAAGVTRGYFETLYREFYGLTDAEATRRASERQALTPLLDRATPEQAKDALVRMIHTGAPDDNS